VTLLSSIQSVARRVGIGAPSAVVSATDDMTLQLLDLAQESAETIGKRHGWQNLRGFWSFYTVAALGQSNSLPADYDRMAPGNTMWNLSMRRPVRGPVNPDDWAEINAYALLGSPNLSFRLVGGQVYLYPVPGTGQLISFEFVSKNTILAADGTTKKATFSADTDTVRFPEHLFVKDLRWRWKSAKGLNYAQEMQDFERAFELEAASDRGPREVLTADWLGGDCLAFDSLISGGGSSSLSADAVAALLPYLPTVLPASAGLPWNNGGLLSWS
jgi:hypothetical protein